MPTKKEKTVRILTRIGCVSIGIVYSLIGVLAMLNLLGLADEQADEEGAMNFVVQLPAGEPVLWCIALGLLAYVFWRFYEAIKDPYDYGTNYMGLATRLGIAFTGVAYAAISLTAFQELLGGESNGEEEQQALADKVLSWDYGVYLVGAAALATLASAIIQFIYGAKEKFAERLNMDNFSKEGQRYVCAIGKTGYFARGVILLVLSIFIAKAAWFSDSEEIGDTNSAFAFLSEEWYGDVFFAMVAIGTILYGFFMFIFSRYYRFKPKNQ